MRFLASVVLVVALLVAAAKLSHIQLPILDYPLGGPMAQPQIVIDQDPDVFP